MVVAYETLHFKRHFVLDEERILRGRSFHKEREKGEVYLAKLIEQVEGLGSIFDLDGEKGLCQEKGLRLGEMYLVEIIKKQEEKYPLLSTKPGWISEHFIYRPKGGISFSKEIPQNYRKALLDLGLSDVYFRRDVLDTPLYKVKREYDQLLEKIQKLRSEDHREPGLVHRTPFKEEGEKWIKLHLEERILQLRKGIVEAQGLTLYLEPTRAGLVVDVNGVGKEEILNEQLYPLLEEILELMNVGGLVIIDLIGRGKGYKGPGNRTKEGIVLVTRPVRGADLFRISEEVLQEDYTYLKKKLEEAQ